MDAGAEFERAERWLRPSSRQVSNVAVEDAAGRLPITFSIPC